MAIAVKQKNNKLILKVNLTVCCRAKIRSKAAIGTKLVICCMKTRNGRLIPSIAINDSGNGYGSNTDIPVINLINPEKIGKCESPEATASIGAVPDLNRECLKNVKNNTLPAS